MKPGDILPLEISSIAYGGDGVGRVEGRVFFVPGAIQGETVSVRCLSLRRNFARGEIVKVLSPSPHRIEPACPLYGRCPGCSYQHADYAAELAAKQQQLLDLLRRIGRLEPPVAGEPFAAPARFGYRNKLVLHAGGRTGHGPPALGYYGADNRTVLDVPECPLAHPEINAALAAARADNGFMRRLREGASVTLRRTGADGVMAWTDSDTPRGRMVTDTCAGMDLLVPAASFFQVNPEAASAMVRHVEAILREFLPGFVCDAYSGSGLLAFAATRAGADRCVCIEEDSASAAAGAENARRLGFGDRVSFIAGRTEDALPETLSATQAETSVLIMDPPRTGLGPAVAAAVCESGPVRVVYVSCAADTLARDAARMKEGGYSLTGIRLFDMFPATAHFETVAVFERPDRGRA
ncbi:MAG: class I SAM-dependent RNA methyltransferase [Lentisphaerae bacterium]|nr:class I SAM-dependent RNA methyltransferase [Lentisphaerota bacterium]